MLHSAKLGQDVARDLYAEGVYVAGLFFPLVAKGLARRRTQLSAAHERHHLGAGLQDVREGGSQVRDPQKGRKEIAEAYGA
jgi:7-keto-8-aminopelargonate synthetase-like enzyme